MKSANTIQNKINLPINFDVWIDVTNLNSKPFVIISHGYKGFKDWGFIPYLSEMISQNNCIAINLDFSLNGIVDSKNSIFDPELFAINTISQEIEDLNILIDFLKIKFENAWDGKIFLIGHSLGGAISIITANERNDISGICLMGTISTLDRNTQRQKDLWRTTGRVEMKIPLTNQIIWQNVEYLEDKENNKERFNLLNCVSKLNMPILIIHGEQDVTVPIKEAKLLLESAINNNQAILELIPQCNHIFNVKHPLNVASKQIEQAFNCILSLIQTK
jgi:pimeloyl-ACP methyl ester carboxylesterase